MDTDELLIIAFMIFVSAGVTFVVILGAEKMQSYHVRNLNGVVAECSNYTNDQAKNLKNSVKIKILNNCELVNYEK